jgi:hypothetical protein
MDLEAAEAAGLTLEAYKLKTYGDGEDLAEWDGDGRAPHENGYKGNK